MRLALQVLDRKTSSASIHYMTDTCGCAQHNQLGSKKSLKQEIHEITKIAVEALRGGPLTVFEIKERLSWANGRETKRPEDEAYSLLGIFNVFMPLLYGEGRDNAMARLREEIGKLAKCG
jgi:hypothetical protein